MTILLYKPQNVKVEIDDDPYVMGGHTYIPVKAIEGKPFADGAKTTTRTAYKTVDAKDLSPIPQDTPKTLLDLALAAGKKQWSAGETIWIWGSRPRGAFLKEEQGWINLCLTGKQGSTPIFWLNPDSWQWEMVRDVKARYQSWRRKMQAAAL